MMKKIYRKKLLKAIYGISLAGVLVTLGFNCSHFDSATVGTFSSSSGAGGSKENAPPVALLSSDQMLKTMISVTGTEGLGELTDPADALINDTYNLRSGALPTTQELNQATGPAFISATNLAATVCAKAVDRDAAIAESDRGTRVFFRETDFTRGLAGQSAGSVASAFERMARNAWRRDATQAELTSISGFANDFGTGASASDPAQTRLLAVSVCTVVISSFDTLTY